MSCAASESCLTGVVAATTVRFAGGCAGLGATPATCGRSVARASASVREGMGLASDASSCAGLSARGDACAGACPVARARMGAGACARMGAEACPGACPVASGAFVWGWRCSEVLGSARIGCAAAGPRDARGSSGSAEIGSTDPGREAWLVSAPVGSGWRRAGVGAVSRGGCDGAGWTLEGPRPPIAEPRSRRGVQEGSCST